MKLFFSSGTAAFKAGLILLNIKSNDEILIPQFVCDVLIQPLKELNIKQIYFKIKKDLTPDWRDIDNKFSENVKAIVMINYFGFPSDIKNFINFKKKKNIYLIEDNCHGYGGFAFKKQLGTYGDIGFDSPGKIITNLYSGGILYINNKKMIKNSLPRLERYQPSFFNKLKFFLKKKYFFNYMYRIFININFFSRDDYLNKRPFNLIDKLSKKLIIKFDYKKEKKKRVQNYIFLQDFLYNKFNVIPLYRLNNDTKIMPWCYPGIINNKIKISKLFLWLKEKNVDIFFWPTFPLDLKNNKSLNKLKNRFIFFSLKNNYYENTKYQ